MCLRNISVRTTENIFREILRYFLKKYVKQSNVDIWVKECEENPRELRKVELHLILPSFSIPEGLVSSLVEY